jgi:hypothetical protein
MHLPVQLLRHVIETLFLYFLIQDICSNSVTGIRNRLPLSKGNYCCVYLEIVQFIPKHLIFHLTLRNVIMGENNYGTSQKLLKAVNYLAMLFCCGFLSRIKWPPVADKAINEHFCYETGTSANARINFYSFQAFTISLNFPRIYSLFTSMDWLVFWRTTCIKQQPLSLNICILRPTTGIELPDVTCHITSFVYLKSRIGLLCLTFYPLRYAIGTLTLLFILK